MCFCSLLYLDLSSTVGTYERLRVQDQRSIETLKEELEKRLLVADTSSTSATALAASRPRERLPPIGANEEEEDDKDEEEDEEKGEEDLAVK